MQVRPISVTLVNWALFTAGFVNLGAGTWRMLAGDAALASGGIAAGLILLLAATIERFELVKGLGIEAKTRELTQKIDQAEAILSQMRRLAETTGATLVQLASRAGRWNSVTPPEESYQLSRDVKKILEAAGSPRDAVRAAITPWARFSALDIAHDIVRRYKKPLSDLAAQLQADVTRFSTPIRADDPTFRASVDKAREVGAYAESLYPTIKDALLAEYGPRLQALLDTAPSFVPAEAVEQLRADMAIWGPEFDHLTRELDFRDTQQWIRQIEAVREAR